MARLWPALDIHVPACDPQLRDLVIAELDDFKLFAIQEEDGASAGGSQTLRAFFSDTALRNAAASALGRAFRSSIYVEPIDVDDHDWAARSQAHLEPVTVGRLVISPRVAPGFHSHASAASIPLIIPPSMGFGTVHHATTRLMLEALQSLDLANRHVLDVGCGSAILAIAAVRLGARHADAIDVDPDALAAATENVRLNDVSARVRLRRLDISELDSSAAIVLANLTGALLGRYAVKLAEIVTPGGYLIVSGFMQSELDVVPALSQHLTLARTSAGDEWSCAIFRR